jgi:hypothetical protein
MTLHKLGCSLFDRLAVALAAAAALMAADFDWNLPKGFPRHAVPADNERRQGRAWPGCVL